MKRDTHLYTINSWARPLLLIFGIVLSGLSATAQQEAMNAQFILNTMAVNPGYTGYREVQSITIDHRSQWVGFDGAPTTQVLGFDMALPLNPELAVGGNLMHDKIGPTSELGLSGNVAYRFQTSRTSFMSIGLKGYAGLFQARYTSLDLTSEVFGQEDINFSQNPSNLPIFNVGVGAYYHSDKYFVGLSSPRLLKNKLDNNDLAIYNTIRGRTQPTYYFMGGYSFPISAFMEFQPAFIARATAGAPVSVGLYGSFILRDKWRIGGFYALQEAAGALIQMQISDQLSVGYSFDLSTNSLISTNFGSHEITARYDFRAFRKRMVYPRRF